MYFLHAKQRHKRTFQSRFSSLQRKKAVSSCHEKQSSSYNLLEVKPRLECLPPRATLISSAVDYPKEIHAQSTSAPQQHDIDKILRIDTPKKIRIIKTKDQILEQYPNLFKGIGRFPGEPYHIHTNPSITPK